jgi:hypothetical protein
MQIFCAKTRQIGQAAFADTSLERVDTRSQAIEFGIVMGRVYSRRLCGATKQLTQMQQQSIDALGLIFHTDTERPRREDYEYWIKPPAGSLQDDVSTLFRTRGIAPAKYIADPVVESLFYDSAAYFGANGLMHLIATKSKVRTPFEELEMRRTARKIDRTSEDEIVPPEL